MSEEPKTTIQDIGRIKYLIGVSVEEIGARVGHDGVQKIVPYCENGSLAPVVWFAVYDGDGVIVSRINGAAVGEIGYFR